jgi:hypothetical protein
MAHSAIHFSVGMAVAAAAAMPTLLRGWQRDEPLAERLRRWFAWSLAAGTFAVFPAILRRLGVPAAVCEAGWANLFLFHPLINRLKPGGETMGPLLLGAGLAFHYAVLLAAVLRARRRATRRAAGPATHNMGGVSA